jgi:hypothetical protein
MNLENNQNQENSISHGSMVEITIDTKKVPIHRGHQTIVEIKQAGSILLAYDLEQVVDGTLIPLADDSNLTIKGDEVFISHQKDASSS